MLVKEIRFNDYERRILVLSFEHGIPDDPHLELGGSYGYGEMIRIAKEGDEIVLEPGNRITLYVPLPMSDFKPGMNVEIKLHSASENEYYRLVKIP